MITSLHRDDDETIKLTITLPSELILKTRTEVLEQLSKEVELPGFRKGKAPKKLVEQRLNEEKVREEILKKLIPQAYLQAVKEHNLKPIMNPQIHVEKIEPLSTSHSTLRDEPSGSDSKSSGQADWQFHAITCEMPKVELNSYKDSIKKVTAKSKIVIPGKEPEPPKLDDIIKALLESVSTKIPKVLIQQEADRLLVQLLEEVKKLGLTLDQYLASTNRTGESLRAEYEKKAQSDITFEFALSQIAEAEHITVDPKEIEEAIQKAPNEQEKKHLEQNRYLLASILRQQKTLDFLKSL